MKLARISVWALAVCGLLASTAMAQRGTKGGTGVARQATRPEIVTLTGTVVGVETGPCENTTGRAYVGTHFVMKSSEGDTLNIHLGPAGVVDSVAKKLAQDKEVQVEAFRTEAMKEGHYAACKITSGEETVTLRDDLLRPTWAGSQASGARQGNSAGMSSRGRGAGWGRGAYGQGNGRGYGNAYAGRGGRAGGYGYGYGAGRGRGYGRGQGAGYGAAAGQCPWFSTGSPTWQPKAE